MFFSGGNFTVRIMDHLYPCGLPACPGVCFKRIIFHLSVCLSVYLFLFQLGLETRARMLALGKKYSCTELHPSLAVRFVPLLSLHFYLVRGTKKPRRIVIRISLENFYANVTFVSYIIFQLSKILCFKISLCKRHLGPFSWRREGAVNMDGPTKVVSP